MDRKLTLDKSDNSFKNLSLVYGSDQMNIKLPSSAEELEKLISAATAEALRQISSSSQQDKDALTHSVAKKIVEEHLSGKKPLKTSNNHEADNEPGYLSDLSGPHLRLLRCDDESCEYEDLVNGVIKVKPITKKLVKLRWEEFPRSVLVVLKPKDQAVRAMAEDLFRWLINDKKLIVVVEPAVKDAYSNFPNLRTWRPSEQIDLSSKIHFVICLGGDGTVLWAQGLFGSYAVPPMISFAGGSLGFLTAFDFVNHRTIINNWITDGGFITLRLRLKCHIHKASNPQEVVEYTALNEVLIDRGPSPFLTKLECFCDGVYTTTVQADGLIIATTTGSTAYSLAAGGSMVHPLVPCILFTPVKVPATARSSAWLTCDGKSRAELCANDSVSIRISDWCVPVVCKNDETSDWFHSVTDILHWNNRKQQKPNPTL